MTTLEIITVNMADLADRINREHEICLNSYGDTIQHAIIAGELLNEAKSNCKHGEWIPWVEANCSFDRRTASRYMLISNRRSELDSNGTRVSHLTEALKQLSDPDRTEKRPVSYHVSDDTYDWFTPTEYIEAARFVMGSIDVDPASSHEAQEIIKAEIYYTKETDGLSQPWYGNVWLNPPYNMPIIEQFIDMVLIKYLQGEITSAIVLTNNSTDTGWFHKLVDYPICFTRGRIQFWNGDEKLATRQGQAIFYLGKNPDLFADVFNTFGVVLHKYVHK